MKIYIASSWKQSLWVERLAKHLRETGHEVFAFCESNQGHYCFKFSDLEGYENMNCIQFLDTPQARRAFVSDRNGIDWADCVIMLLPCGKSSHLEAGYAKGQGKRLVILGEFDPGEFDVMYGFADSLVELQDTSWSKNLAMALQDDGE